MMSFFRRFHDLGINGFMAKWYDNNSRTHRLEEMRSYAKEVAKCAKSGDSILEVAPGPGYLSIELSKLGTYNNYGLDISNDFVNIALKNAKEHGVIINFQQGNVSKMPYPDCMFNFIICTAAFKNFKEPVKALSEMYRVLKSGGAALIIDMNKGASSEQLDKSIKEMNLKGFDQLFMQFAFKSFLKNAAYNKDSFNKLILQTLFKEYEIKEMGISLYVYLKKN
ncbi:MAG TPA: class I SAM-dependent methyltransferase [Chitinivibrionales bacterium]|nr:class I SAM-dependent methyltransferase [Chitinivibrionales bacterium]